MQRFAGKTIVVKYGGAAMKDPTLKVRQRRKGRPAAHPVTTGMQAAPSAAAVQALQPQPLHKQQEQVPSPLAPLFADIHCHHSTSSRQMHCMPHCLDCCSSYCCHACAACSSLHSHTPSLTQCIASTLSPLLPTCPCCLQAGVITDLVLLWTVGIRPVLVHGGGPEINSWLERLGIQPEFKNGLRVTDGEPWWGPVGGCPGGGRR